jgi:hypothetical protein
MCYTNRAKPTSVRVCRCACNLPAHSTPHAAIIDEVTINMTIPKIADLKVQNSDDVMAAQMPWCARHKLARVHTTQVHVRDVRVQRANEQRPLSHTVRVLQRTMEGLVVMVGRDGRILFAPPRRRPHACHTVYASCDETHGTRQCQLGHRAIHHVDGSEAAHTHLYSTTVQDLNDRANGYVNTDGSVKMSTRIVVKSVQGIR